MAKDISGLLENLTDILNVRSLSGTIPLKVH